MRWPMEHQLPENIIRVTVSDRVFSDDAFEQVVEAAALTLRTAAAGIFVDCSAAVLEMPLTDLYKVPKLMEREGLPRQTRIAIAVPGDAATIHKYRFFDEIANRFGFNVRLFWEPTGALAWLQDGDTGYRRRV